MDTYQIFATAMQIPPVYLLNVFLPILRPLYNITLHGHCIHLVASHHQSLQYHRYWCLIDQTDRSLQVQEILNFLDLESQTYGYMYTYVFVFNNQKTYCMRQGRTKHDNKYGYSLNVLCIFFRNQQCTVVKIIHKQIVTVQILFLLFSILLGI